MKLNIRNIEPHSGKTLDFSFQLDLKGVKLWGQSPLPEPVTLSGQVRERSGILTLRYTVDGKLCFPCARCLTKVDGTLSGTFIHTVVENTENPDDDSVIVAQGGMLDMTELATADICLNLEPVTLCSPDCRGLCPDCGADLNFQSCNCAKQPC